MSSPERDEEQRVSKTPSVIYVIDGHGEGWYCTGVDENDEPETGVCVHEDEVPYVRDFGG